MALITGKSIFIHIQKTGGMTVRHAMHLCSGNASESGAIEVERHYGLPELLVAHPGIDENKLTFGFVRHPVDWLVSRWTFARRTGFATQKKHRPSAASMWLASCWDEDLSSYIDKYLERYPGIATQEMFRRLGLWTDKPVQRVGYMENLVGDLIQILDQAGETFDKDKLNAMRKHNASSGRERVALTETQRERILQAESVLIERFYSGHY